MGIDLGRMRLGCNRFRCGVAVITAADGSAGPPTPNGPGAVVPSASPTPRSCRALSMPTGIEANRCTANAIGSRWAEC
jgi:hypothetical protein